MFSPKFEQLVHSLKVLPGVGPRSAQRMALHLLANKRQEGLALAASLQDAMQHIGQCQQCRVYSETDICHICASPTRDEQVLCVVESVADVVAIEQSGAYRGKYFVLCGRISPLDGIGPDEVGIPELVARLKAKPITELILATNATIEGQTTAHYIQEATKQLEIKITRIAQGVPLGGEIEYVDSQTLHQALQQRLVLR